MLKWCPPAWCGPAVRRAVLPYWFGESLFSEAWLGQAGKKQHNRPYLGRYGLGSVRCAPG